MEQKCKISILIQDDNSRWGNNDFVKGKIIGFTECICKKYNEDYIHITSRPLGGIGILVTTLATAEEYVELKVKINEHYPELCKFGISIV